MKRWLLLWLAATAPALRAQTAEDLFQRGNEAYRLGNFREAISQYEAILNQGLVSAEVYFNLGNAHYRQGAVSRAILAYERARRLSPGDEDIEHNLRLANLRTLDRIEPLPELFLVDWFHAATGVFPLSTTAMITFIAWVALFSSLALLSALRIPAMGRIARWTVPLSLVVVLLCGLLLVAQSIKYNDRSEAIVVARVVTAKTSPDPRSVDAFVLHEGLKVRLGDQVGDWVRITLADGKVGWMKSGDCERI